MQVAHALTLPLSLIAPHNWAPLFGWLPCTLAHDFGPDCLYLHVLFIRQCSTRPEELVSFEDTHCVLHHMLTLIVLLPVSPISCVYGSHHFPNPLNL